MPVRINLKRPNHKYLSCHPVGRQLTFPVTTTRYIPWVEFVFPSEIWPVIISKSGTSFGTKNLLNIRYVVLFSPQNFYSKMKAWRYCHKCTELLIKSKSFYYRILMNNFWPIFEKYSNVNLIEIHQVEGVFFHVNGQTARRTR